MDTTEIVLTTKDDAEQVVAAMRDILNKYEVVTVADFLELVGISSVFTDNKKGWTNLRNVEVKEVENGFVLELPSVKEL